MTTDLRRGACALTLALAASLSLTATASADDGPGAFRLGTDVRAFSLLHYPEQGEVHFQAGFFGTDLFFELRPQLVVSGAYQVTDAILIGARVGLGYQELVFGSVTADAGIFGLLPFFEYMFGEGEIRPFVGAEAGFQLAFSETFGTGDLETEALAIAGGLGGVHIFAADGFSISPGVAFDFLYWGQSEWGGYQLVLFVSLEGWIGGASRRQAARTTTAETLP